MRLASRGASFEPVDLLASSVDRPLYGRAMLRLSFTPSVSLTVQSDRASMRTRLLNGLSEESSLHEQPYQSDPPISALYEGRGHGHGSFPRSSNSW